MSTKILLGTPLDRRPDVVVVGRRLPIPSVVHAEPDHALREVRGLVGRDRRGDVQVLEPPVVRRGRPLEVPARPLARGPRRPRVALPVRDLVQREVVERDARVREGRVDFFSLLGDMTGSFFKRRRGLKREGDVSSKAPLLDTLPFAMMVFLLGWILLPGLHGSTDLLTPMAVVLVATPVLHRSFNMLGYAIGWKDVPY